MCRVQADSLSKYRGTAWGDAGVTAYRFHTMKQILSAPSARLTLEYEMLKHGTITCTTSHSHIGMKCLSYEQIRTMGSGAMTGYQVIAASLIAMRSHSSQKSLMDQQPLVP